MTTAPKPSDTRLRVLPFGSAGKEGWRDVLFILCHVHYRHFCLAS
jgi:hypothetical protein